MNATESRIDDLERRLQRCLEWAQHHSGDPIFRLSQILREATAAFQDTNPRGEEWPAERLGALLLADLQREK